MHRPHARTTTLATALLAAIAVAACSTTHESPVADETGRVAQAERASQALAAQAARRTPAPPAPAALHMVAPAGMPAFAPPPPANTEHYAGFDDNPVHRVSDQPVSTFSVDVDTGSYSNVRRMLLDGVRPPADAVRAEEFINYFDYGHPAPSGTDVPFGITTELAPAPWNAERRLLMIGIKGYDIPRADLPPSNLVLLIDTSGSMNSPDKLPLLKRAMGMLVRQLRPQDTVSIVVYAGSAGLVLPPSHPLWTATERPLPAESGDVHRVVHAYRSRVSHGRRPRRRCLHPLSHALPLGNPVLWYSRRGQSSHPARASVTTTPYAGCHDMVLGDACAAHMIRSRAVQGKPGSLPTPEGVEAQRLTAPNA